LNSAYVTAVPVRHTHSLWTNISYIDELTTEAVFLMNKMLQPKARALIE